MAYTRDQIYAAMRNADKAGDSEAVKALAQQLQSMDNPPEVTPEAAQKGLAVGEQSLQKRIAKLPPAAQQLARQKYEADPAIQALQAKAAPPKDDSFLHGIVLGAMKPFDNLASWASHVPILKDVVSATDRLGAKIGMTPSVQAAHENDQSRANNTSVVGQTVGNIAGTMPVLAATGGGALVQGGLYGALTSKDPENLKNVARDTVLSAVLNKGADMALNAAAPVVKKAVRKVFPAADNTAAQEVVNAGDQAGVRVMTSDVKPPETFIGKTAQAVGERIPFAGTGGQRAAQQAERIGAVKTLLTDYGGDDAAHLLGDPESSYVSEVAKNLTATRSAELSRLTATKDAVINKFSEAVPTPNATEAIDAQIGKLERLGMPETGPVIAKLQGWKAALSDGKSLRDIEEIRKIMGQAFDDPGLAGIKTTGQKAVNAIYAPLREDMGNFIEHTGGAADETAWRMANDKLASMAGELDSAAFRNVLKNSDTTPEAVGRLLFSKNPSDVARLYANLDEAGQARAQAAVLQRAFDKAISPDGGLSVERFANNIKSLGSPVGVVFKGEDAARIEGLTKLLNATRRAAGAAVQPATGAQNMPIIGGYALGTLFGQAALPVAGLGGLFARAYESAPVRNVLLRLGRSEAGSAAETGLVKRATELLTASAIARKLPIAANENVPAVVAAREKQKNQQDQQSLP